MFRLYANEFFETNKKLHHYFYKKDMSRKEKNTNVVLIKKTTCNLS